MRDFGQWFAEQTIAKAPEQRNLDDQFDEIGYELHADGSVYATCCVCARGICLTDYLTAEEILRGGAADQYCGRDPRCCP